MIHGVLKLTWNDGYEGIVDLRPVISRGQIFVYLQSPENFKKVKLEEYGHSIGWINASGEEIDFGSDNLRRKAENLARLHMIIAEMRS